MGGVAYDLHQLHSAATSLESQLKVPDVHFSHSRVNQLQVSLQNVRDQCSYLLARRLSSRTATAVRSLQDATVDALSYFADPQSAGYTQSVGLSDLFFKSISKLQPRQTFFGAHSEKLNTALAAVLSLLPDPALEPVRASFDPPDERFGRQHSKYQELCASLERAVQQPNGPAIVQLLGMPGMGKSTLGQEVAHDMAPSGLFSGGVHYLRVEPLARGTDSASATLAVQQRLVKSLQLPDSAQLSQDGASSSSTDSEQLSQDGASSSTHLYNLLDTQFALRSSTCLILLDGVWEGDAGAQLVQQLLFPSMQGVLLLTARSSILSITRGAADTLPAASVMSVYLQGEDTKFAALQLIQQIMSKHVTSGSSTPEQSAQAANSAVQQLYRACGGNMRAAHDLAMSFVNRQPGEEWQLNTALSSTDIPRSIADQVLQLQLDPRPEVQEAHGVLAMLLSFTRPGVMLPFSLLQLLWAALRPSPQYADKHLFQQLLQLLHETCLIEVDEEPPSDQYKCRVHPLTRAVLEAQLARIIDRFLTSPFGTAALQAGEAPAAKLAMLLLVYGRGPPLDWAQQHLEIASLDFSDAAQLLSVEGYISHRAWASAAAEQFMSEPGGNQHCLLGDLFAQVQQFDTSNRQFRMALDSAGADIGVFVRVSNSWASVLQRSEQPAEAEAVLQDALSKVQAAPLDSRPSLVDVNIGLAQLLWLRGKLDDAVNHYRRALQEACLEQDIGRQLRITEALKELMIERGDRMSGLQYSQQAASLRQQPLHQPQLAPTGEPGRPGLQQLMVPGPGEPESGSAGACVVNVTVLFHHCNWQYDAGADTAALTDLLQLELNDRLLQQHTGTLTATVQQLSQLVPAGTPLPEMRQQTQQKLQQLTDMGKGLMLVLLFSGKRPVMEAMGYRAQKAAQSLAQQLLQLQAAVEYWQLLQQGDPHGCLILPLYSGQNLNSRAVDVGTLVGEMRSQLPSDADTLDAVSWANSIRSLHNHSLDVSTPSSAMSIRADAVPETAGRIMQHLDSLTSSLVSRRDAWQHMQLQDLATAERQYRLARQASQALTGRRHAMMACCDTELAHCLIEQGLPHHLQEAGQLLGSAVETLRPQALPGSSPALIFSLSVAHYNQAVFIYEQQGSPMQALVACRDSLNTLERLPGKGKVGPMAASAGPQASSFAVHTSEHRAAVLQLLGALKLQLSQGAADAATLEQVRQQVLDQKHEVLQPPGTQPLNLSKAATDAAVLAEVQQHWDEAATIWKHLAQQHPTLAQGCRQLQAVSEEGLSRLLAAAPATTVQQRIEAQRRHAAALECLQLQEEAGGSLCTLLQQMQQELSAGASGSNSQALDWMPGDASSSSYTKTAAEISSLHKLLCGIGSDNNPTDAADLDIGLNHIRMFAKLPFTMEFTTGMPAPPDPSREEEEKEKKMTAEKAAAALRGAIEGFGALMQAGENDAGSSGQNDTTDPWAALEALSAAWRRGQQEP